MMIVKRSVVILVLLMGVCIGLSAQSTGGRFGMGYAFLEANGTWRSFPGGSIEVRVLPFRMARDVLRGVDLRRMEDVRLSTSARYGDIEASVRLVAVVPANERARFSLFAGPLVLVSLDPGYPDGVELSIGAVLGSGGEVFLAPPFSVGLDVGFEALGPDPLRFSFFAGLLARYYFR